MGQEDLLAKEEPGGLQLGSQRFRHNLAMKQETSNPQSLQSGSLKEKVRQGK